MGLIHLRFWSVGLKDVDLWIWYFKMERSQGPYWREGPKIMDQMAAQFMSNGLRMFKFGLVVAGPSIEVDNTGKNWSIRSNQNWGTQHN